MTWLVKEFVRYIKTLYEKPFNRINKIFRIYKLKNHFLIL